MTWVALKSLAERRVRAVLTALAIVLGVAMVAGSFILTDTIDRAFTNIFGSTYTQTDLVVRGDAVVDEAFAGTPTVSADLLPRIQALPGVEAAAGSLVDFSGTGNTAKILDRDGEVIGGNMPSFGFGVDPSQERFNPLGSRRARWASGSGEVVVDAATASGNDIAVGDAVRIVADGPVREFTVTGIARFGDVRPPRRRDHRRLRRPHGPRGARQDRLRRHPGRGRAGDLRRRAGPPHRGRPAPRRRAGDRRGAGRPRQGGGLRGDHVHPRHPAGLRRHRPVRGRLRDLQHPLDHGGPALARARHAAHPRRIAPAGAAVGGRRGRRHRPGGLAGGTRPRLRPRPGADGAVRQRRARDAPGRHRLRDPHRGRVAARRDRRHPAGGDRARRPGDPGPADRGRPRGCGPAGPPGLAAHRRGRRRGHRRGGRAPGARRPRRRRHLRAPAGPRRRLPAPVHRRRDDLVAPRAPDRRPGGLAGRAPGRLGAARPPERRPQPGPHRGDRRRPDGRPGAGHVRQRPRHRPARHDREGRGAAGRRGLRRDLHQRLGPAPAGRRAGAGRLAGGGDGQQRPPGLGARRGLAAGRGRR